MKGFAEHEDACNYAKANPGFIVVRDVPVARYGQNWVVGDRAAIYEFIRYDLEYRRERERERRELEEEYEKSNERFEQGYDNEASAAEAQEAWEDYDSLREQEIEDAERHEHDEDPDDWNRSGEEGWFYNDEGYKGE